MDPKADLDGWGKSRLTGIRSPDLPAHSELLYRLRYPGSRLHDGISKVTKLIIIQFFSSLLLLPALRESKPRQI